MKSFIVFIGLIFLTACSGPSVVRVKNCNNLGNNIYECEELPKYEYDRNN